MSVLSKEAPLIICACVKVRLIQMKYIIIIIINVHLAHPPHHVDAHSTAVVLLLQCLCLGESAAIFFAVALRHTLGGCVSLSRLSLLVGVHDTPFMQSVHLYYSVNLFRAYQNPYSHQFTSV